MKPLTRDIILHAFSALDQKLEENKRPTELMMGGGGAMILAHGFPLSTSDVDAIPKGPTIDELDRWVKEVDQDLKLGTPDWLNPYFSTFSHTLPLLIGPKMSPMLEPFSEKESI